MKIKQIYSPEEFKKISKIQLYDLWFRQALTEKKIAQLFGIEAEEVKEKRLAYNIKWINSAIASVSGTSEYTSKEKIVAITPPENWDGKLLKLKKAKDSPSENNKMSTRELLDAVIGEQENNKAVEETENKHEEQIDISNIAEETQRVIKENNDISSQESIHPVYENELEVGGYIVTTETTDD